MNRMQLMFCRLIEVISLNSTVTVTLFMDDIQWADDASLAVLGRLLRQDHKGFFFLGCGRDDELLNHPFWKTIEHVRSLGINTTTIQLDCVDENALVGAISETLCLLPRLVSSISSIIHSRTQGNILFVQQLLLSFRRDGLLYVDCAHKRWKWGEDKILASKLPENIATCYINDISTLPSDVQSALVTISLLGASVKKDYIELLQSKLETNLVDSLNVAAKRGLLSMMKDSYTFCHDRIQETCFNMVDYRDRIHRHLLHGKCLIKHALGRNDDELLFTAINQINLGGRDAITEQEDFFEMAS